MNAETTRGPLLPEWARAWRMKLTWPRCQLAQSSLETAALMRSCASEMTSLTPRKAPARELAQEGGPERLGLGWPDIHAEHFAAAIAVDAHRHDHRDRNDPLDLANPQVVASIHR